jgi:hypothetical protein
MLVGEARKTVKGGDNLVRIVIVLGVADFGPQTVASPDPPDPANRGGEVERRGAIRWVIDRLLGEHERKGLLTTSGCEKLPVCCVPQRCQAVDVRFSKLLAKTDSLQPTPFRSPAP